MRQRLTFLIALATVAIMGAGISITTWSTATGFTNTGVNGFIDTDSTPNAGAGPDPGEDDWIKVSYRVANDTDWGFGHDTTGSGTVITGQDGHVAAAFYELGASPANVYRMHSYLAGPLTVGSTGWNYKYAGGPGSYIDFAGGNGTTTERVAALRIVATKDGDYYDGLELRGPANPGTVTGSTSMLKATTSAAILPNDAEVRGWIGHGTSQQVVSLAAAAATFAATKTYAVVAADAGGNTLTTITCTGCQEGDRLVMHKSGANALTLSASGTGANQIARACVMDAADATAEYLRTEGGYWAQLSCVP